MNWYSVSLRALMLAIVTFGAAVSAPGARAAVFVYEVVTKETSFHTASKLPPDAFLMYNGGEDIVYSLKVLRIYADKDYDKALRDYELQDKNVRFLPHIAPDGRHIKRRPYYWWR